MRPITISLLVAALLLSGCDAAAPGSGPLRIRTTGPLLAPLGMEYSAQLEAEGGRPPYSWSLVGTTLLPPGLGLSSDGVLAGAADQAGTSQLALTVKDASGNSAFATIELSIAEQPPNDACAGAVPIRFDMTGKAAVPGTLAGARADGAGRACALGDNATDVYYQLELTQPARVTLHLQSLSNVTAAIYDADCASPPVQPPGCVRDATVLLPAGTYTIAVAGTGPASFELQVTVVVVDGDRCDDPVPLDLSSGSATVMGSFEGADDDYAVSCGKGPDRVYALKLDEAADLQVKDIDGFTIVALRRSPCSMGGEVACARQYGQLVARDLTPGIYYLIVKDVGGLVGTHKFSILVERTAATQPPPNDRCDQAQPLDWVDDSATIAGLLLGATYDPVPATCSMQNNDVYYTFDLAKRSILTITNRGQTSRQSIQIFGGGACDRLVPLTCTSPYTSACAGDLAAGRYYIRVASSDPSDVQPMAFAYRLTRSDPPVAPANDTCAGATSLAIKAGLTTVQGQVAGAADDYTLSCNQVAASDAVYELTLDTRYDLQLDVSTPSANAAAAVFTGACANGTQLACSASVYFSPMKLWGIPAGKAWVIVESVRPQGPDAVCWDGGFTLRLNASASPPAPANDACGGAIDADLATIGSAVALKGTTQGATNDFTAASCLQGSDLSGPDVVYRLKLGVNGTIRVTATSRFDGMVFYLTSACGSNQAIRCASNWVNAFTTDILPAGSYYLTVDGPKPGDFSLVAELL